MTLEEQIIEQVSQMREDIAQIKTALKGYDGQPGLCERHDDLEKSYYKFKRLVISVFAFLVGSGVISVSVIKGLEVLR